MMHTIIIRMKYLITASTSPEGIKEVNKLMEKIQKDGLESLRRMELVTLIELFTGKILVHMKKPDMQKTFIDSIQFVWMDGGPIEELIRIFKTFIIKEYKLYYNG